MAVQPLELWRRIASNEAPSNEPDELAAEGARLLAALQDAVAAGKADPGGPVADGWEKWRKSAHVWANLLILSYFISLKHTRIIRKQ